MIFKRKFLQTGSLGLLMSLLVIYGVNADDSGWQNWRGPNSDGTVVAAAFEPDFPRNESNQLWNRMIGDGYSSMTVSGDRIYTLGRNREGGRSDRLFCIDTETGDALWTADMPLNREYSYSGPRAQPVLEDGVLYYVNPDAVVYAVNANGGRIIWSTDLKTECGARPPEYGLSGSVVIEDNMLVINACSAGVALNKADGGVIWQTDGGSSGFASPVVFSINGTKVAGILGPRAFNLVRLNDGTILDSIRWIAEYNIHATDPLLIGDNYIFLSSAYRAGACLLDYSGGELETVWNSQVMKSQFSSLVQKDGYLYGIDGSTTMRSRCFLKCIDPVSGEEMWKEKIGGYGSLILVNDTLVVLDENGNLTTVKAQPDSFQQIAERRIFEGRGIAWVAPVFDNNRIYLRSNIGELVCVKTD